MVFDAIYHINQLVMLTDKTESIPISSRRHYSDKHITLQSNQLIQPSTRHRYNKSLIESQYSSDSIQCRKLNKRPIKPPIDNKLHLHSKKQYPHIKYNINTGEQSVQPVLKPCNKSIQQSTDELSFPDELGGHIHRWSEHELNNYLTSNIDGSYFLNKSVDEKYQWKLSQYIQQCIHNKSNIDTTPDNGVVAQQRVQQQIVNDIQSLPDIQYTVEPFINPFNETVNDKNKVKNKRQTLDKNGLNKTIKSSTKNNILLQATT